jgi:hypothetical protein
MSDASEVTRKEALRRLKLHEIAGPQVYLIDIIPLIEMIWADGKAQESEIEILEDFLRKHVERINALADHEVLTLENARDFILRFLRRRPDPELLSTLRSLVAPVRLSTSDPERNAAIRDSLLAACLDIAASAVVEYPYGLGERFGPAEKRCFFEILESL